MDLRTQTKITVLVEKISYLLNSIQQQGHVSKIDKDLMSNYVKELYEATLQLQVTEAGLQQQATQQNYIPPTPQIQNPTVQTHSLNGNGTNGIKLNGESINEKNGVDAQSLNDNMRKQQAGLADKLKQTPIKELKTYIGLNKRFAFINSLFNGNTEAYDQAIDEFDACTTYQDALSVLQNKYAAKLKWRDDDELLAELGNFVLRRFLV